MATTMNSISVTCGPGPWGVAEGGSDEEEKADVDKEEEAAGEASEVTMVVAPTATKAATDTETES
jgi:hypothetical protein